MRSAPLCWVRAALVPEHLALKAAEKTAGPLPATFPKFDRAASPAQYWRGLGTSLVKAVPLAIFVLRKPQAARALALVARAPRHHSAPLPTSKTAAGRNGGPFARQAHSTG